MVHSSIPLKSGEKLSPSITCTYSGSSRAMGLGGEKECLVIKDLFTGIIVACPLDGRAHMCVVESVKYLTGRRKIQQIYSDNAPEFINAARCMGIVHETSTPGVPRTNQLIIGGTVTSMVAAGTPPCYWSYAAPCWCFNYNTERIKDRSCVGH